MTLHCAYDECRKEFTPTRGNHKFCSKKCRERDKHEKHNQMMRKVFGCCSSTFYKRRKNNPNYKFKKRRRNVVKMVYTNIGIPDHIRDRMKRYPTVNWSAEITAFIEYHLNKLDMI